MDHFANGPFPQHSKNDLLIFRQYRYVVFEFVFVNLESVLVFWALPRNKFDLFLSKNKNFEIFENFVTLAKKTSKAKNFKMTKSVFKNNIFSSQKIGFQKL